MLREYGIQNVPITVNNPQSQGIVERSHKTIANILRTTYDTSNIEPAQRKEILQEIAWAMRASWHRSLKASPCQVVFNRDMIFDTPFNANWVAIHQMERQAREKNNMRENKKRIFHEYKPEEKVWLMINVKRPGKLYSLKEGQYKIISVLNNGTAVIDKGQYTEVVNIRRLTPVSISREENVVPKRMVQVTYDRARSKSREAKGKSQRC
jgi:hypothetical protein